MSRCAEISFAFLKKEVLSGQDFRNQGYAYYIALPVIDPGIVPFAVFYCRAGRERAPHASLRSRRRTVADSPRRSS